MAGLFAIFFQPKKPNYNYRRYLIIAKLLVYNIKTIQRSCCGVFIIAGDQELDNWDCRWEGE